MAVVDWTYSDWSAAYPTVAAFTTSDQWAIQWDVAQVICDNTDCSVVPYDPPTTNTRKTLLGLLLAHMCTLAYDPSRQGLVGRIAGATQGSVSVNTEMNASQKAAWFNQTSWGATYYQATLAFRLGRYVPGPQPFRQPRRFLA